MSAGAARSRRGRPRTVPGSGADPREEILTCAARLFSARGMNATRMSDVARAVGVATPSVYYHFDNLDAIAETLLRFVVEESAAFAVHIAAGPGSHAERLYSLVQQHVRRLTDSPYDLWFVAGLTEADLPRFPFLAEHAGRWREVVRALIDGGVDAGEFRPIDPGLALALVSGTIYGALQHRHELGTVDADEVARFISSSIATGAASGPRPARAARSRSG